MRISDWSSDVCSSDLSTPCADRAGPLNGPSRCATQSKGPADNRSMIEETVRSCEDGRPSANGAILNQKAMGPRFRGDPPRLNQTSNTLYLSQPAVWLSTTTHISRHLDHTPTPPL